MRILEPNDYKGELGDKMNPFWINTEEVFIVNGEIFKADGDFIEGDDDKNVQLKMFIKKQSMSYKFLVPDNATDDENDPEEELQTIIPKGEAI